ncbi:hypothetical protein BWP39_29215 [Paraburkholderia acidicola]|uniref:HTH marR-type domain-containing protein n=1 Tax=Paraburkholderia acidicola TaxID=1912599 RepID=A0A2A4ETK2_9BURK|nr:MarR family transcriptional regulator [Paraburkholderia acidicola]PCE23762.1 hypothetical protein BWP39_29215 [Paraburkholderia acidicola]
MTCALSADKAALLAHASQSSLDHLLAQRSMREIARRLNDALRSLHVSAAQFCLLALLYRDEPPTVSELAQEMQMETAHVSAQLSILMRRALVVAHAGQGERRRRRLTLTPYGQSVLLDALPLWIAASDDASHFLGSAELHRLSSLAKTVHATDRADAAHASDNLIDHDTLIEAEEHHA